MLMIMYIYYYPILLPIVSYGEHFESMILFFSGIKQIIIYLNILILFPKYQDNLLYFFFTNEHI